MALAAASAPALPSSFASAEENGKPEGRTLPEHSEASGLPDPLIRSHRSGSQAGPAWAAGRRQAHCAAGERVRSDGRNALSWCHGSAMRRAGLAGWRGEVAWRAAAEKNPTGLRGTGVRFQNSGRLRISLNRIAWRIDLGLVSSSSRSWPDDGNSSSVVTDFLLPSVPTEWSNFSCSRCSRRSSV